MGTVPTKKNVGTVEWLLLYNNTNKKYVLRSYAIYADPDPTYFMYMNVW